MAKKAWILLALLTLSCGGRTTSGGSDGTDTGDGDSGDDGGTSDDGGDDGGDGDGDDGGGDDGGDDGGTGGDDCEGYDNEDGEWSETTVMVTNTGTEVIFLGGLWSCDLTRMSVVPAAATDDTHWPARKCEFYCQDVIGQGGMGCDDSCPMPPTVKLDPGGVWSHVWTGAMHYPAQPPDHCCLEGECYECYVRQPATEGDGYTATVNVFEEVTCLGDQECDCVVNDDGWCELEGFVETYPEDGETASVTFEYPASEVTLSLP